MIGVLGGAFDPPHNGHVGLARGAKDAFGLERLVFLVAANPGHKDVGTSAEERLALAQAAFSGLGDVVLDEHARTIDAVHGGRFGDAVFVVGADEFADFLDWMDPNGVLEEVRLAVGTRPGYPRERLEAVLERLERPDRVLFFDIAPIDISSRDLRARRQRGEPLDGLVPAAVSRLIEERGLYRELD